jgi:hypothetical protein
VLVVTAGRTTDDMLVRAVGNISKTRGRLLGVVLNRVPLRGADSNYYGAQYGGYYGYGVSSSRSGRSRRWSGLWRRASKSSPGTDDETPGPRRRSPEMPPSNVSGLRTLSTRRNGSSPAGETAREGAKATATTTDGVGESPSTRRKRG